MEEKEKESQEELSQAKGAVEADAVETEAEAVDDTEPEAAAEAEAEAEEAEEVTPEPVAEAAEEAAEEAAAEAPEGPVADTQPEATAEPEAEAEEAEEVTPEPMPEAAKEAEAEETVAEEPVDTGPPKRWYVVHTYSGHENKVRENIQKMINTSMIKDQFGQIIVPTEEVAEMKKGKKTITTRKFFPSYILVEMFMSDESRHLVSDIPGVTSFVGTASGPQPLSKAEVERILGRMDKEKQTIIPEIPFTLGEHIRIKDGPFSDFTGIIDEINAERGKLKVLVSIFGRETPVELDFLQVENL
jgi:transcriptional antiterminator NusG